MLASYTGSLWVNPDVSRVLIESEQHPVACSLANGQTIQAHAQMISRDGKAGSAFIRPIRPISPVLSSLPAQK